MTNKTIIDGIDVSKCKFFDRLDGHIFCCCEDLRESKTVFENLCKENQNCYFKELAKAEQEIEKLKEWQEANKPTGICETCTDVALSENDKLKAQLRKIKQVLEIEELKKGVLLSPKFSIENGVSYYTITQGEYEKLKKNCTKRCKADKYKQALVDIKKYQQRNCETCVFANTQKCNINCQVFVILAIIESAKDGE